jgi:hypothetical protein
MEIHKRDWHATEHIYSCDYCDRSFYSQTSLDSHNVRIHRVQNSFSCELCGYQCTQRVELESHIQAMHYHNTRYDCDECQFNTFTKAKLVGHKKITHRYECDYCNQTFSTTDDKDEHEKEHLSSRRSKRKRYSFEEMSPSVL